MKKLFAILMAVVMIAMMVPAASAGEAAEPKDVNPVGQNIAGVNAPYLMAGGNASTTDFLTAEDFASHTITIINVWSNGCGPCVQEMPYFQQVHEEFGQQGVLIVGCCSLWIGGSYAGEWNHLQQNGYTYVNVIQDSVLMGLYQQNNYVPQTFIVNSEGTVVDFIGGGTSYENLVAKIGHWMGVYSDDYYNVDFVNGVTGEIFETQSVHAGFYPEYPTPPEVEGYNFTNWSPANPPIIMGDTTITANYTLKTYRVRFYDSITGEKLSSKYVQHGSPVEPPEAPVHEGYTFVGWDHDLSCVTEAMDVYTIYEQGGAVLPGDVDGDNEITVSDALVTLRAAMGIFELTPAEEAAADFDGDGSVTVQDALLVLRAAMGIG